MPKITKKINAAILVFTMILLLVNVVFDYLSVRKILSKTYDNFLVQIAYTGASYFKADKLAEFARQGLKSDEYRDTMIELANLTENTDISFLYVIIPNMPDCKKKTYVFNIVNTKLRNRYNPYAAGYRDETSDEGAARQKRLMEKGGVEIDSDFFSHMGPRARISLALRDSTGKNAGIICVEKQMDGVINVLKTYTHIDLLLAPLFTIAFLLFFGTYINRRFVRPLVSITKEADSFASHDAHFSDKLKEIHSGDEIETLARSIEKMGVDIQGYIKDLMRATSEKERISAELSVASGIQSGMLPKNFSPYKEYPGIQLYASMIPAKEVGGDFYDFFWTAKDMLWLVIGDVSGKGVPAAMFMAIAKNLIRTSATQELNPGEICERVNNLLCKENEQGLFVTCWLARVDLSSGRMKFANAAHNPPVLFDGSSCEFLRQKSGLMLAAIDGSEYSEHEILLKKGSRLFLYTDGVTEAQNKARELFGEGLLLSALAKTAALSAQETVQFVNEEVERFAGGEDQADDITTLMFALDDFDLGAKKSALVAERLALKADDGNLRKVLDFVLKSVPAGAKKEESGRLELAVEEVFVNISHYAYQDSGDVEIICERLSEKRLRVVLIDSGKEFNPLKKEDPDFATSAQERKLGGFGIYLTKQFMDKVDYQRKDGKNFLTIEKEFS